MKLIRLSLPICLVVAIGLEQTAHAKPRESFALIVTNNRSFDRARPTLKYADDDGAKYYEMFRLVAPKENILLLGKFDADTAQLFPGLPEVAQAPTRRAVFAAAGKLKARVRQAKQQGREVAFYFVFAGHGDVEKGRGFIELEDGPFYAEELQQKVLKAIPAEQIHVILDSCNSFFLINSRKPGGRRFVTSKDILARMTQRLPNVGVFLSTSAEAEVFEWSELQSGIFSHAVRSGLLGGADVNRDGRVSYRELEAFVNTAASKVRNPLFRPKVYSRGPGGKDMSSIVDLADAKGTKLTVKRKRQMRISVRDNDGLRWIDLHKEQASNVSLFLPPRLKRGFLVEERSNVPTYFAIARHYETKQPSDTPIVLALANLPEDPQHHTSRGLSKLFRMLFASPFGPVAFNAYANTRKDHILPAAEIPWPNWFARVGVGVAIGIKEGDYLKGKTGAKITQDIGMYFQRDTAGPAIALSLAESFSGGVFNFQVGPRFLWDFRLSDRIQFYLTPYVGVGYMYSDIDVTFSGGSSGFSTTQHSINANFGIETRMLFADRFSITLRPAALDLLFGASLAVRYDAIGSVGVIF